VSHIASPIAWATTGPPVLTDEINPMVRWVNPLPRPEVTELRGTFARFMWEQACFRLGVNIDLPNSDED
jgi:hypothetical protein